MIHAKAPPRRCTCPCRKSRKPHSLLRLLSDSGVPLQLAPCRFPPRKTAFSSVSPDSGPPLSSCSSPAAARRLALRSPLAPLPIIGHWDSLPGTDRNARPAPLVSALFPEADDPLAPGFSFAQCMRKGMSVPNDNGEGLHPVCSALGSYLDILE